MTNDLTILMAEREEHLAAWDKIMNPLMQEIDTDAELASLYNEHWKTYRKLNSNQRQAVKRAILRRKWPASFAIRWYKNGKNPEGYE